MKVFPECLVKICVKCLAKTALQSAHKLIGLSEKIDCIFFSKYITKDSLLNLIICV